MSLLHVVGFGLKVGHLLWVPCCLIVSFIYLNWFNCNLGINHNHNCSNNNKWKMGFLGDYDGKVWLNNWWEKNLGNTCKQYYYKYNSLRRSWWRKLWHAYVVFWIVISSSRFLHMSSEATEKRKESLVSLCDERARMLQDQFNVSMNHIQAMSILISTFHHAMDPSAIDQKTFARYTERTAFERPLTSGVAYAVRVLHSEREQFEKQQGWTIKRMDTLEQNPVQEDDFALEALEPSPIQEEYAPVIFAQETIKHVISVDVLSGKEDRENVLRARESGKGVLTAPFRLLKTNRLGVILTFAVYKKELPSNATPDERIQATDGYLGGVFDIESLVEKLLQQLASKQSVIVNVYDTTNHTHPIAMYGSDVLGDEFYHVSTLNFGDPFRKHEMHCRFKQKPPWPWEAIHSSVGMLVIAVLIGYILYATVNRMFISEDNYNEQMELKKRAQAADVAKSQFLATVSHEIRTPMNGVLGMLNMLMDTDLDVTQQEYVRTAQGSGKALVSLINEVLDQAKIDSGKLELEAVVFDLRAILDDVLLLFSEKSQGKGVELAVYVSDEVPEQLIGDPGRFRQIITNLMGNSIKFTEKGHIFVTIHLVEEVVHSIEVEPQSTSKDTLSGYPVADIRRSWEGFKAFSQEGPLGSFSSPSSELVNLIVSVEDTGVGIPLEAQSRIFTPFMQVDPSISRKHGGTGIGLSISKCLVGRMNGEIGFVSIPNIGSTFTFTAVFTNGSPNSKEGRSQQINNQPHLASSEFHGTNALVIDPRPIRAKVSRYHLQRLDIRVELVSDLDQGLSLITNGNSAISIVFIEQEVWDRDSSISSHFVNNTRKVDPPKLFILVNSNSSFRASSVNSGDPFPVVITKPLKASMLAVTLQRAMGVGNRGNTRNVELPSLSLQHLLRGRRILVVDDNSVNRTVAAGALKKYGADVVCVSSGKDAISKLKPPHQFDACFMDIQMPEMDGFEATRRIRELEHMASIEASMDGDGNNSKLRVPILAMTADVMQATNEECLKSGMDGYVSKPFEAEQLYREVSRFFPTS
ncbi:histidine kinase 3 [Arachis duranensis]|uniref:histidine kinase n=2 Tax=Arachis TaxID=3817 RepID=A0A2I4UMI9_ARAHY|nr:histidine kinase 3 [Arachis duranensis]ATP66620.1 histidine kinase 3 [Arachis hypogaea]